MPTLDCTRCGDSFDTEREPAVPGADTSRCPACGKQHELGDSTSDRSTPGTATASVDADSAESDSGVTVEIHVHE